MVGGGVYESPHDENTDAGVRACFFIDALSMSDFIHLSSKAPWVTESCYIILLWWYARPFSRLSLSLTHGVMTKHAKVKLYYITAVTRRSDLSLLWDESHERTETPRRGLVV